MECEKLPPASDLTVPPPPCTLDDFSEEKDLIVGRRFTLDEVITKGSKGSLFVGNKLTFARIPVLRISGISEAPSLRRNLALSSHHYHL